MLLGIGRSGHVGFNEPGSSRNTRTRMIVLDEITRKDAASDFFGEENVPQEAITIGVPAYRQPDEVTLLHTLAMPFEAQRPTWQFSEDGQPTRRSRLVARHELLA
jgi:hypothetical protein